MGRRKGLGVFKDPFHCNGAQEDANHLPLSASMKAEAHWRMSPPDQEEELGPGLAS